MGVRVKCVGQERYEVSPCEVVGYSDATGRFEIQDPCLASCHLRCLVGRARKWHPDHRGSE